MPIDPPFQTAATGLFGGINYWEDVTSGGFSESADNEGNVTATRILYCKWSDRLSFRNALLGWSRTGFVGSTPVIKRSLPEPHPDTPKMYCVRAELIEGRGVPQYSSHTGLIAFYATPQTAGAFNNNPNGYAYFRTEWMMLPWDVKQDGDIGNDETQRYVNRWETFAAESVSLPGASFQFVTVDPPVPPNINRKIPEGIPKLILGGEFHMKWMEVPSENNLLPGNLRDNIRACVNHVNVVTFQGYAPGTLLCLAPHVERRRSVIGTDAFDIEYAFGVKEKEDVEDDDALGGWNTIYRRDMARGPGFDEVEALDQNGDAVDPSRGIYLEADFQRLFQIF